MEDKWRNRDWIWLIGILIVIIVLIVANKATKSIESNFSIISSSVSIALALIAIFYSLKQDSDNKRSVDTLRNLVTEIKFGVEHLLEDSVETTIDSEIEKLTNETPKDNYTKDELDEILNNIKKGIKEGIDNNFMKESFLDKRLEILMEKLFIQDSDITFEDMLGEIGHQYNLNNKQIKEMKSYFNYLKKGSRQHFGNFVR